MPQYSNGGCATDNKELGYEMWVNNRVARLLVVQIFQSQSLDVFLEFLADNFFMSTCRFQ